MTLMRRLQNLGLITLITVLIWLYAEAQSVGTQQFTVAVRLPERIGQTTVVDPTDRPSRFEVVVDLSGNSVRLSDLRVRLARADAVELPLEPGDLPPSGQGPIDLKALLARAHISQEAGAKTLTGMGVSITAIEPKVLNVKVDELVSQPMDVIFSPQGVQIDPASLKIDPPRATMILPRTLIDQNADSPDVFKVEAVPQVKLENLPPGVKQTVTAQLKIPPALQSKHTRLKTESVDLTFIIASQTARHELGVVPVWLLAPPSELQRYRVTLADDSRVLKDVTITGPRQLIEQLKAPDTKLRVVGRFELTADDLDKAVTSKPVSHIEIQQVEQGRVQVLEIVPLNPESLVPTTTKPPPTFQSSTISITTSNPVVHFTIAKPGE